MNAPRGQHLHGTGAASRPYAVHVELHLALNDELDFILLVGMGWRSFPIGRDVLDHLDVPAVRDAQVDGVIGILHGREPVAGSDTGRHVNLCHGMPRHVPT